MRSRYAISMDLQERLDSDELARQEKIILAAGCLSSINQQWNANLRRGGWVHKAYFIDDKLTSGSYIQPFQEFGKVVLAGTVPQVKLIDIKDRLVVAMPFYDATILGPRLDIEPSLVDLEMDGYDAVLPLEIPLRRPLYTPVESVGFLMMLS